MKLRHQALVLVGLLFVLAGCVEQQEYQALRSMVYENRTSLNNISQQVAQVDQRAAQVNQQVAQTKEELVQARQTAAKATQTASQAQQKAAMARQPHAVLKAEVDSLRQDVARVRGSVEEIDHRFQKLPGEREIQQAVDKQAVPLKTEIGKLKTDVSSDLKKVNSENQALKQQVAQLSKRLTILESYLSINSPRPKSGKKSGVKPAKKAKPTRKTAKAPAPPKTAKGAYELARTLYKKKSYQAARDRFQDVIARYPNSIYVPSAHFWVGESFYSQKKYEEAVLSYNTVIKHYSKSPKVPSALLKQGLAFRALGDIRTAKTVLKILTGKYPKSQQAATAKRVLAKMK